MDIIYFEPISKIALIWIIAVITPGPNLLISLNTAFNYGKRQALYTDGGIVFGTAIWAISGFLGIRILFILAPWLYKAIKTFGAAYLIYLGAKKLFDTSAEIEMKGTQVEADLGHFRKGLMVNLTNPKTALFISSLFAANVPKEMDIAICIFSVITIVLISFSWYSFMALVFSHKKIRDCFIHRKSNYKKVSGVLFISLGIKMVLPDSVSS